MKKRKDLFEYLSNVVDRINLYQLHISELNNAGWCRLAKEMLPDFEEEIKKDTEHYARAICRLQKIYKRGLEHLKDSTPGTDCPQTE